MDSRLMDRLNIPVAKANIVQPPSGETKVTITESVRDYDVYILNTVSGQGCPSCEDSAGADDRVLGR
jgi:phosphoribosylpyrophosphate synthetase